MNKTTKNNLSSITFENHWSLGERFFYFSLREKIFIFIQLKPKSRTGCPKKVSAFDQRWSKSILFDFKLYFVLNTA